MLPCWGGVGSRWDGLRGRPTMMGRSGRASRTPRGRVAVLLACARRCRPGNPGGLATACLRLGDWCQTRRHAEGGGFIGPGDRAHDRQHRSSGPAGAEAAMRGRRGNRVRHRPRSRAARSPDPSCPWQAEARPGSSAASLHRGGVACLVDRADTARPVPLKSLSGGLRDTRAVASGFHAPALHAIVTRSAHRKAPCSRGPMKGRHP